MAVADVRRVLSARGVDRVLSVAHDCAVPTLDKRVDGAHGAVGVCGRTCDGVLELGCETGCDCSLSTSSAPISH